MDNMLIILILYFITLIVIGYIFYKMSVRETKYINKINQIQTSDTKRDEEIAKLADEYRRSLDAIYSNYRYNEMIRSKEHRDDLYYKQNLERSKEDMLRILTEIKSKIETTHPPTA